MAQFLCPPLAPWLAGTGIKSLQLVRLSSLLIHHRKGCLFHLSRVPSQVKEVPRSIARTHFLEAKSIPVRLLLAYKSIIPPPHSYFQFFFLSCVTPLFWPLAVSMSHFLTDFLTQLRKSRFDCSERNENSRSRSEYGTLFLLCDVTSQSVSKFPHAICRSVRVVVFLLSSFCSVFQNHQSFSEQFFPYRRIADLEGMCFQGKWGHG